MWSSSRKLRLHKSPSSIGFPYPVALPTEVVDDTLHHIPPSFLVGLLIITSFT